MLCFSSKCGMGEELLVVIIVGFLSLRVCMGWMCHVHVWGYWDNGNV